VKYLNYARFFIGDGQFQGEFCLLNRDWGDQKGITLSEAPRTQALRSDVVWALGTQA